MSASSLHRESTDSTMRVSKLLMITKWRLSHPETAQGPVGSPSDATITLLNYMRAKFRLICV